MLVISRDRLKEDDARKIVVILDPVELANLIAGGPGHGIQTTVTDQGVPLQITVAQADASAAAKRSGAGVDDSPVGVHG